MENEADIYKYYIGKRVRITKQLANGKNFFYRGLATKLINNKLIINDKYVGQIVIAFDEIKLIEVMSHKLDDFKDVLPENTDDKKNE